MTKEEKMLAVKETLKTLLEIIDDEIEDLSEEDFSPLSPIEIIEHAIEVYTEYSEDGGE
ncbi:MAG: hypothetical protein ACHQUC_01395 [Chlamydiales bacterium]